MHARFLRLVLLPALVLNLLAYGLISTFFQPQAVHAQAYVVNSDPIDGSTISSAPHTIRIFFNDSISPLSTSAVRYVKNGDLVNLSSHSSISASNRQEIDISLPTDAPQGSYLVSWTAISTVDGRTTYGSIGFNVGSSSLGLSGQVILGPSSSTDFAGIRSLDLLGLLSVAWEWLVLAALVFWIGILVIERLVLVRTARSTALLDRARRQSLPLQWLCLSAMLIGEVITLLLREVHVTRALYNGTLDFSALGPFLSQTVYGWLWLLRIVLLLLISGLLWWFSRPYQRQLQTSPQQVTRADSLRTTGKRPSSGSLKSQVEVVDRPSRPPVRVVEPQGKLYTRGMTQGLLLLTLLLVITYALTSTPLAQSRIPVMFLNGLSLLAQGTWLGGTVYLGYIIIPLLATIEGDGGAELLVALLRNLTPYLVGGVLVELGSLVFLGETTIPTLASLSSDPYGRTLLVSIALDSVILLLALYIVLVMRPGITRRAVLLPVVDAELPARRTRQSALERQTRNLKYLISIQTVLGAGILLCAALMLFFAPPIVFPPITYANQPVSSATSTPVQTQQAGGLSVTLQFSPAHANALNTVTVHIVTTQGTVVTNAHVQLTITMQTMNMGVTQQTANNNGSDYTASFPASDAFSMSGVWNIRVTIQQPGQATVTMTFPVPVA
jgi:methionine-rich copper-binding protein CopC